MLKKVNDIYIPFLFEELDKILPKVLCNIIVDYSRITSVYDLENNKNNIEINKRRKVRLCNDNSKWHVVAELSYLYLNIFSLKDMIVFDSDWIPQISNIKSIRLIDFYDDTDRKQLRLYVPNSINGEILLIKTDELNPEVNTIDIIKKMQFIDSYVEKQIPMIFGSMFLPKLSIAKIKTMFQHLENVNYFDVYKDYMISGMFIVNTKEYPLKVSVFENNNKVDEFILNSSMIELKNIIDNCTSIRITYIVDGVVIPENTSNDYSNGKTIYESRFIITQLDIKFNKDYKKEVNEGEKEEEEEE